MNDVGTPASDYGLNTGVTNPLYGGLPRINVNGFFGFPAAGIGGFNWPKVQGPDQRFQFIDHVTITEGKHSIKFGVETHKDSFSGGAYGGSRGRFKFGTTIDAFSTDLATASAIEDFFAGVPSQGQLLIGDPTRHIHNWGTGLFIQDDWRVTSHLTVNFGLRYELSTVIKDSQDQLANFDPQVGLVQVGKGISGPYNRDPYNFGPRAGFAWDINGNNRTVIRGGAGIIYETVNWEAMLALNNNLGLNTIPTGGLGVTPGNGNIATGVIIYDGSQLNWDASGGNTIFPTTPINCSQNFGNGSPCTIMGMTQNFKTPYVYNWNLNVQHAFNQKITLEAAYVGNHGSKLLGIRDINQVDPNSPAENGDSTVYDANGNVTACSHCEQAGRPYNAQFPFLGQIYQVGNYYKSNYNGLQLTLTGRDYHGLSFLMGYTYSHALDNVGANWDFGAGLGLPQDSTHPMREYASSDFDMRHRFTLSLTYAIPGVKTWGQLLEGWQVNTIVSLYGAQPWGPIDAGTDSSLTGEFVDRWNFTGSPSDFKPTISEGVPWISNAFFATDVLGNVTGPAPGAPAAAAKCFSSAGSQAAANALASWGCYAMGNSVMTPPASGTFGTMGRNLFRDFGFKNVDFSAMKNFNLSERFKMQFRAEFFNLFNHPNFANPFGGQNGWGRNDPSVPGPGGFGCSCATPDVAASNPVIGSGGSRAVQLGLKFTF